MWGKPAFAALLVLALGGAVVAAAAGGYGSQSDPLVTLSYITDVAVPEANTQIDSVFQAKQKEIESQISTEMAAVQQELESAIQQADPASQSVIDRVVQAAVAQVGGNGGTSNQWRSVTVPAGQSLLGSVGCQVILRSGSASCYSGMVDLSSGGKILHGDSVVSGGHRGLRLHCHSRVYRTGMRQRGSAIKGIPFGGENRNETGGSGGFPFFHFVSVSKIKLLHKMKRGTYGERGTYRGPV